MALNQLPKFDLKNKITFSLLGFALVLFILIYFIIVPTTRGIQTMGRDIEEQRIDLEKKYLKGNSLRRLTENLKKIEPKLNLLDQIFINKNRELEFITATENESNKSQVDQKINLNLPKTSENQIFQKGGLELSTVGAFNQQLNYLVNLESLGYYINAKLLELTPSSAQEKNRINN